MDKRTKWSFQKQKYQWLINFLKSVKQAWRDGSAFKSTGCSSRVLGIEVVAQWQSIWLQNLGYESQHTHDGWQSSITPGPRDLMSSSGLHKYQACKWCTSRHASKTFIHIKHFKYLTSLAIRIMKSQTTLQFYPTPLRLAAIRKT